MGCYPLPTSRSMPAASVRKPRSLSRSQQLVQHGIELEEKHAGTLTVCWDHVSLLEPSFSQHQLHPGNPLVGIVAVERHEAPYS